MLASGDSIELIETDPSQTHLEEFLIETQNLSILCNKYGFALPSHSATGVTKFLSHPIALRKRILDSCRQFLGFCASAENEGLDLKKNNIQLTWFALKQLNLRPHSDLFNHITDEHIVEVYNENAIQIYRSFNLFQYLSYSISDIFSHEWWELYTRDNVVFDQMLLMNDRLLDGSLTGVVKTNYPDHWVQEIFSPKKLRATMKHELFTPLNDTSKKNTAFISAFRITHSESTV